MSTISLALKNRWAPSRVDTHVEQSRKDPVETS